MGSILSSAAQLSPRVMTFFIAMLPVSELRGAIPYALAVGRMEWLEAYLIAVAGNFVPVIPILFLLENTTSRLRKYRFFDRFFEWFFSRTRRRGTLIRRFGALGLVMFVAIPLPVTGAWTGCAAAFLFGVPRRYTIPAVALGILIAGCVVMLASLGFISFWRLEMIRP